MNARRSNQWFDPLFRTEAARAIFCDAGRLQGMLDFEAALARAEARANVIPTTAAAAIARACRAELFDLDALAEASAAAGNSAIPVVKALTTRVAQSDASVAQFVHLGATSQDAMDTGLVLQLRSFLDLIDRDTRQLCDDLAALAEEHKKTPIAGRTWLQHAAPTTFGLKVAGWLGAIARDRERLTATRPRVLALQFGGAVGTLAALGDRAIDVARFLAEELNLAAAPPWHGQRDRIAEIGATLGVLVGSLGKIARDVSLLSQSEIGELAEPTAPGRGGSSSMPQKQNPVGCAAVLSAATRVPGLVATLLSAMPQEHERGLGGWHAEWETLPEICLLAAGALATMRYVVSGLQVDAERMRANLDATRGAIYAESLSTALAASVGKPAAHKLVEAAARRATQTNRSLREVATDDAEIAKHLPPDRLAAAFDPAPHVRAATRIVDETLAAYRLEK